MQTSSSVTSVRLFSGHKKQAFYVWLFVTLIFVLLPYLVVLWSDTPDASRVVQTDARHFVVWLRRMIDPQLYPNDYIADFYGAVTPWLYRALYWPFTTFSVDPIDAHFYFVMPLTGLLLAFASYIFIHHFWPSPIGAAIAAILLINILGWPNGLAHDFGYSSVLLITLAFISRSAIASAATTFFAAGLLPTSALVSVASIPFLMLSGRPPFVSRNPKDWAAFLAACVGLLVAAYVIISSVANTGPTVSLNEARSIPYLSSPDGYLPFWGRTFVSTYMCNDNAGIVPLCGDDGLRILAGVSDAAMLVWAFLVVAVIIISSWLIGSGRLGRWTSAVDLPPIDCGLVKVWASWLAAGVILFLVAHALLFEFHSPNRFSRYTTGLVFSMMIAMGVALSLMRLVRSLCLVKARRMTAIGIGMLTACVALWASIQFKESYQAFRWSRAPQIGGYLRTTPKDTLVAGIVEEIHSVPTHGWRSVLSSIKLMSPLKKVFYRKMSDRISDVAIALYADDQSYFERLVMLYGIDFVLVERVQKDEPARLVELANNFPRISETAQAVINGRPPFFRQLLDECARVEQRNLVLADAVCLSEPR